MAHLAKGQITIVDLNDAKTLSFALSPNIMSQIYAADTKKYVPDIEASGATKIIITPTLYDGGSASVMTAKFVPTIPTWKINGLVINGNTTNANKFGASIATSAPYALTITKNIDKNLAGYDIECEAGYRDEVTLLTTKVVAKQTVSLNTTAGVTPVIYPDTPDGYFFDQKNPGPLRLVGNLYKGAILDNTGNTYKWEIKKNGAWVEINASNSLGCTGYTTNTLTVPASAVVNFEYFKLTITDKDNASGTAVAATHIFDLHDKTDPYTVDVYSASGGDKLVNGQGSITLTADIYQAGEKVTDLAKFDFKWRKSDANGNPDNTWGTSGVKTGQSITVTQADVARKAVFFCELHSK